MSDAKVLRRQAVSNIIPKDVLREVQIETLQRVSDALRNSYGPNGSTSLIRTGVDEKDTGKSSYTKDGHNILSAIKFSKPIEMSILDDLKDITRNTVKTVGDGTTSAVILSNAIFQAFNKLAEEGYKEKDISNAFAKLVPAICEQIEKNKQECTLDTIEHIAYISTDGNTEVAKTIRYLYEKHGMGVYIDPGISNTPETVIKSYDGLTVDAGYFNTLFINNTEEATCELKNPYIYIFEDPIDTPEMLGFCYKIIEDNIFAPTKEYLEAMQKGNQKKADKAAADIKATVIFSPAFGRDIRSKMDSVLQVLKEQKIPLLLVTNVHDMDRLTDLATLSGAKMIKKYIDPQAQKDDVAAGLAPTLETISKWFFGRAQFVSADMNTTKIVSPQFMYNEDGTPTDIYRNLVDGLIAQLKQYEETKTDLTDMHKLRRRIKSIQCNMVEYLVGGISYTDRDALKDAIEDAVLNCRSAAENGVGYGANFEAFYAINNMEAESTLEVKVINALFNAYKEAISLIYDDTTAPDKFLEDKKAYNATGEDVPVLCSIKTDEVILEAISQIVGLMFKTNQFICVSPTYNTYTDF